MSFHISSKNVGDGILTNDQELLVAEVGKDVTFLAREDFESGSNVVILKD